MEKISNTSSFLHLLIGSHTNNNEITTTTTSDRNDEYWYTNSKDYMEAKEMWISLTSRKEVLHEVLDYCLQHGDKEQQPSLSLSISKSKQENQSVVECHTHRIQAIIRMLYTILTIEIIPLEEKSCMSSIILNKLVSSFSMKQRSLQGNINDNDDTNNTLIYTLEELFTRIHPIIKTLKGTKIMSEFWKRTCQLAKEISKQCPHKHVSKPIVLSILEALLQLLHEGATNLISTLTATALNEKTVLHQCTLLQFLLMRLLCIVVCLDNAFDVRREAIVTQVFSCLALLRGLKVGYSLCCDGRHENVDLLLGSLEVKVDHAFSSIMFKETNASILRNEFYVDTVMSLAHKPSTQPQTSSLNSVEECLSNASPPLGTLVLFHCFLHRIVQCNPEHIKQTSPIASIICLSIPHVILSQIIPPCHAYLTVSPQHPTTQLLLSKTISLVVDALLYHSLHINTLDVHYALAQWLIPTVEKEGCSSKIHPLTLALSKEVICRYYLLYSRGRQGIVQFFIRLVLDDRTNLAWKKNIAMLLLVLKQHSTEEMKRYMQETIVCTFVDPSKEYALEDQQIILSLLEDMNMNWIMERNANTHHPRHDSFRNKLHSYITQFYQILISNNHSKENQPTSSLIQLVSTFILAFQHTYDSHTMQAFHSYYSIQYWSFLHTWIKWECSKWRNATTTILKNEQDYFSDATIFMVRCIAHIMQCENIIFPKEVFDSFIFLLQVWNQVLFQEHGMMETLDSPKHSVLRLEIMTACAFLGKVIPSSNVNVDHSKSLQVICTFFHMLLSSSNWTYKAITLTSFEGFASTLSTIHQSILRSCIPDGIQRVWLCRLKSEDYNLPKDPKQWKLQQSIQDATLLQKQYRYKKIRTQLSQLSLSDITTASISIQPNKSKLYTWDVGHRRVLLFFPQEEEEEDNTSIRMDMQQSMGGVMRQELVEDVLCLDPGGGCSISFKQRGL